MTEELTNLADGQPVFKQGSGETRLVLRRKGWDDA